MRNFKINTSRNKCTYYNTIHSYLLTYLLTPWSRALLEKLTGFQLIRKFAPSHFMESEGSLPHSQEPATCPYPEPARSSPYPTSYFLKNHLNIIFPSTPGSPKWSLSLRFSHQNPVYACPLPHTRYMSIPSHSSRCYHLIKHNSLQVLNCCMFRNRCTILREFQNKAQNFNLGITLPELECLQC